VDAVLGLVGLALFVASIIGLAAAITLAVIKISPAKDKPKSVEPDAAS
jgi:hypothetical protein